jgi:hypothetical protein
MSRISFLRSQIERAKRIAGSMTDASDRARFQIAAGEYQRELDALSSAEAKTADTFPHGSADAIASTSEPDTAASDAIAATDDGAATTSNDTKQQDAD